MASPSLPMEHDDTPFPAPWCELCGPPCRQQDNDPLCASCRTLIARWATPPAHKDGR